MERKVTNYTIMHDYYKNDILDILKRAKKPLTASEVANELCITTQRAAALLCSMTKNGEVKTFISTDKPIKRYSNSEFTFEDVSIDFEIATPFEEFKFNFLQNLDNLVTFFEKCVDIIK